MRLLPKLPPLAMPQPFRWKEWKLNMTGKETVCSECEDFYNIKCPHCRGNGDIKCCKYGGEKECIDCDGHGKICCEECSGEYSFEKYIQAIIKDYTKLLDYRGIVIPKEEIVKMAESAAIINKKENKKKVAA